MSQASIATIFVCTSCRRPIEGPDGNDDQSYDEPGHELVNRLEELTADDQHLQICPIECLAVCKRACTVAFVEDDKWTYIIGDVDPQEHAQDIANAAHAFARSQNGIVPWRERPSIFRKGVVARVPPKPDLNSQSASADQPAVGATQPKESKTA